MSVLGLQIRLVKCIVPGRRCFSQVGFIGLGNMGSHMAKNLLKKGHKLLVFDVNESAVSSLTKAGAERVANPAEMAKEVETIVSMLPSNEDILDVYNVKNGVLSSPRKNLLLIDSSTTEPLIAQTVEKNAGKLGVNFIDAPVSGGVIGAQNGTLTFMVGGSKENFERAKPLLESMGSRAVHCGNVGMGQAAKLCNNMLLAISMIGTAETFNLGQKLGLDLKLLADIVNSSTGRCWSSESYNPVPGILENVPSSNNYEGGFSTALIVKDLGLIQSVANKTDACIPFGSLAHQMYRNIMSHGFSKKDFGFVYKFLKGEK